MLTAAIFGPLLADCVAKRPAENYGGAGRMDWHHIFVDICKDFALVEHLPFVARKINMSLFAPEKFKTQWDLAGHWTNYKKRRVPNSAVTLLVYAKML